jgi:hypothetical protein
MSEGMGWRPIETAPKGSEHPYSDLPLAAEFVLVWNGHHRGVAYLEWDDYDSLYRWFDEGGESVEPEPTHWMPLPEPPTAPIPEERGTEDAPAGPSGNP